MNELSKGGTRTKMTAKSPPSRGNIPREYPSPGTGTQPGIRVPSTGAGSMSNTGWETKSVKEDLQEQGRV